MGGYKGLTSKRTGNQGATSIKAEPAEPQQAATKQGEGQIVGRGMRAASGKPRSKSLGTGKSRRARRHVHNCAASKVKGAHLAHPAAAPHPVGHRRVNKEQPQARENKHGREADALSVSTRDKGHGKSSKHALITHKYRVGQLGCRRGRLAANTFEEEERKIADNAAHVFTKSQGVTHNGPQYRDERQRAVAVHVRRQNVAGANKATVKQG